MKSVEVVVVVVVYNVDAVVVEVVVYNIDAVVVVKLV